MNRNSMKRVIAFLAAGAFSGAVAAGEEAFMKLDRNADGFISAEESIVDKLLYESWTAADTNNDGRIDSAEFSAFEINSSNYGPKE
ncbi:MAG: hypothetical protein AB2598_11675 [Candidatus Thiodiazotropha sp.]